MANASGFPAGNFLRTPLLIAFFLQFCVLLFRNVSQFQSTSSARSESFSYQAPDYLQFSDELIAILSIGGVSVMQMYLAELNFGREAKRRFQHLSTGQLLVGVSYFMSVTAAAITLGAGILLLLYVIHFHGDWYREKFGSLLRKSELKTQTLPGAFWFLLGTWTTLVSFDVSLARYGVLVLSYADPVAAFIGQSNTSTKLIGNATLSGSRACFATAAFIGWLCLKADKVGILAGAAAATFAEMMPGLNDNFSIPIAAAAAVHLSRVYAVPEETIDY